MKKILITESFQLIIMIFLKINIFNLFIIIECRSCGIDFVCSFGDFGCVSIGEIKCNNC